MKLDKNDEIMNAIANYNLIKERVEEVIDLIKTNKNFTLERISEMNKDWISVEIDEYYYGYSNYIYTGIPTKYLFMDNDEIKLDYSRLKNSKEKEKERKKIEQEELAKKAEAEKERKLYEELKQKYEK